MAKVQAGPQATLDLGHVQWKCSDQRFSQVLGICPQLGTTSGVLFSMEASWLQQPKAYQNCENEQRIILLTHGRGRMNAFCGYSPWQPRHEPCAWHETSQVYTK